MNYYQIADAAKRVNVESHVLRYWEEELQLPIERNKQGHRLYTDEDLNRFLYIKELKKEGLQLRAIRTKVHMRDKQIEQGKLGTDSGEWDATQPQSMDERSERNPRQAQGMAENSEWNPRQAQGMAENSEWNPRQAQGMAENNEWNPKQTQNTAVIQGSREKHLPECGERSADTAQLEEEKTRKAARLCMMLQQMVVTAVHEENEGLLREIKKGVAETVSKEMNYQFSIQEQREEEHYKKLDEILRERERRNRMTPSDRKRLKKEQQRAEKEKQRAEKESVRREKEKAQQEHARREKEKLQREKEKQQREKENARREKEKLQQEKEIARKEKEKLQQEKEGVRREKENTQQVKVRGILFGSREKNRQTQGQQEGLS